MKRSLPVVLGLAALVVVVMLVGNGFLKLPGMDDEPTDAAARAPVHVAPHVDPQKLDVDYAGAADDREPEGKDGDKGKDADKGKGKGKDGRNDGPGRGNDRKNGDRPHQPSDGGDHGRGDQDRRGGGAGDRRGRGGQPADRNGRGNTNDRGNDGDRRGGGGSKDEPRPRPDPDPVVVTDLTGDPEGEGEAPAYMDLETVTLSVSGETFTGELTFAGRLPARMPNDGVAMLASIEVKRGRRALSVYAEATKDGWTAHTNRSAAFPGSMQVDGRTLRFTLARSFFGDRFGWYASSSWTKSTTTKTDYFFDVAPDDQDGRFPSGGTT